MSGRAIQERSTSDLLRAIQSHEFDPQTLSADDRRLCVEHLIGEGVSRAQIAAILKVSDRTITRDVKAIHEANALEHDPALAGKIAGRLVCEMERVIERMRRASREANPAVRVDAEHRCFQVLDAATQRLQSLGYLPTAAHRIQADLHHSGESGPSYDDIQGEFDAIVAALPDGQSLEDVPELAELKDQLQRCRLHERVATTRPQLPAGEEARDDLS